MVQVGAVVGAALHVHPRPHCPQPLKPYTVNPRFAGPLRFDRVPLWGLCTSRPEVHALGPLHPPPHPPAPLFHLCILYIHLCILHLYACTFVHIGSTRVCACCRKVVRQRVYKLSRPECATWNVCRAVFGHWRGVPPPYTPLPGGRVPP